MKIERVEKGVCSLCGGADDVLCIDWGEAELPSVLLCAGCRDELKENIRDAEKCAEDASASKLPPLTEKIAAEAAQMTEEDFDEKYLQDTVDRVVFEFIRGYGRMEVDGPSMSMMVLMLENVSEEEILEHIQSLAERGILYPVAGKKGWYGADYPFLDDN